MGEEHDWHTHVINSKDKTFKSPDFVTSLYQDIYSPFKGLKASPMKSFNLQKLAKDPLTI